MPWHQFEAAYAPAPKTGALFRANLTSIGVETMGLRACRKKCRQDGQTDGFLSLYSRLQRVRKGTVKLCNQVDTASMI